MKEWSDEKIDLLRLHIGRDFRVEYPERDWERQRDFERALIRAAVDEARREERKLVETILEDLPACSKNDYVCPEHVAAILARDNKVFCSCGPGYTESSPHLSSCSLLREKEPREVECGPGQDRCTGGRDGLDEPMPCRNHAEESRDAER